MKYILKDENDKSRACPPRNGLMGGGDNYHHEPLKSVNHVPKKRDMSRNKSIMIKDKPIGKKPSEAREIQKNYSMLLLKQETVSTPVVTE